jgi:hypothetical protein
LSCRSAHPGSISINLSSGARQLVNVVAAFPLTADRCSLCYHVTIMEILEGIVVWFLAVLGALTLVSALLAVLVVLSYTRISVTFESVSASPDFKLNPTSVLGSIWNAIRGNLISAAGGFVNGVRLDGKIICRNRSVIPLYLPDIDHEVTVGGKACENIVHTKALWLMPGKNETIPVNFTLATGEIPYVAMSGLTSRGAIDIRIKSRAAFGPFSYVKITETKTKMPDYLPRRKKEAKDKKKPPR